MAQSRTSVHDDLLISIYPRACTRYHGTAAQLIAEGLIPDGFKWPAGTSHANYELGQFSCWLRRCRPGGMKGPMKQWANGDYWCLQRSLTSQERDGWYAAAVYEKAQALADTIRRGTPEWNQTFFKAYNARKDPKYAAFRELLTGPEKRGRGRPAKTPSTTNPTSQGAAA